MLGVPEVHQFQSPVHALLHCAFLLRRSEHALRRELDVLEAGEPRQQGVVLEYHAAVGTGPGHFALGEHDVAAGRPEQSGDDVEQRRLAAARVPDQRDELASVDVEADFLQRAEGPLPGLEHHAHLVDLEISLAHVVLTHS